MSICGADQILLSNRAYVKFKARLSSSKFIPANTLIACAGLYRFKGLTNPEQLWAIGFSEAGIQPPLSGEKAIRLGGKKRIKTHFKHKLFKEKAYYLLVLLG